MKVILAGAAAGWRRGAALALLCCVCAGLCVACGGRNVGGMGQEGSLFVMVLDEHGDARSGADIETDPRTTASATDSFGTALIRDVVPGFYRITARLGSRLGSEPVEVLSGEITRVTVELGRDDAPGAAGSSSSGGRPAGSGGNRGGMGAGGKSGSGGSGPVDADYIDVGTQVEAMMVDPTRPYLYALDKVNNELLFINLENAAVEKTMFIGSSPVALDIDELNDELFVANFGSTQISVVDLETQELSRTLFVDTSQGTWEGNPYRLAVTADNTLAFTSEDQWNNIKLVNATNGGSIAAEGSIYEPGLAASPDGTILFVGESGSTGSSLHRFNVSATALTEVDESGDAGGYGSRAVFVTKDGQYVYYAGQKYLANNLKSVLGKFSEPIFAASADGSAAIGKTNVFDGTTFAIRSPLAVSTTVLAMSNDDTRVYLYDVNSSRIYIQPL
jgi:DNA-binding beta-propeller fold protein YncE